ncbi:MAG: UDP-N-acetylglucosamine 2-epimerase (non-hydrolyzing), partial [Candidatus Methanomethylicota archaeon]
KVSFKNYMLVTVHRAENVDNPRVLRSFVEVFIKAPLPVVFPVHPRTAKNLRRFNLMKKLQGSNNVLLLPPVGYFDFLLLMKCCTLIVTDSGGLQEEATVPEIRKPVLVLRLSTERPEAVEAGFAKVVGVEKRRVLKAIHDVVEKPPKLPEYSPFGDGFAARRVVDIVADFLEKSKMDTKSTFKISS